MNVCLKHVKHIGKPVGGKYPLLLVFSNYYAYEEVLSKAKLLHCSTGDYVLNMPNFFTGQLVTMCLTWCSTGDYVPNKVFSCDYVLNVVFNW